MRTLNADQLKAVLSMESSLGHIHTLADVENTIDYLAKEEPEAVAGVEKFNIFDTPWAGCKTNSFSARKPIPISDWKM